MFTWLNGKMHSLTRIIQDTPTRVSGCLTPHRPAAQAERRLSRLREEGKVSARRHPGSGDAGSKFPSFFLEPPTRS